MVSPSKPDMKGNSETQHDDMPQAGHDEQFGHANKGEKISDADRHEGSNEQTSQEKKRESEE